MAVRPFVSVVIPSLDGKTLLADCLEGLTKQTYSRASFEVVLVDNGSTDGTADWLAEVHPDVRVIREPSNLGFAGGSNSGAAAARGELLVFLNNDTFAEPHFLEELVRVASSDPGGANCVAGRILDWDGQAVEFGGASLSVFGFGYQESSWHERFAEAKEGQALPFACGGAMLIRASVFNDLGGFDPDYFAYYEDVDLGWRLWLTGHRVVYAPRAEVRHRRYGTSHRLAGRRQHFYWYRNALVTLLKNAQDAWLGQIVPFALVASIRRIGLMYDRAARAKTQGDHAETNRLLDCSAGAAEGISWVLNHLDEIKNKRRHIQDRRTVEDRVLADGFGFSVDLGADSGATENAIALRMLPFMDLSGLMTADQLGNAAVKASQHIAKEAEAAEGLRAETQSLGQKLDTVNREARRLHEDLHQRNLEVAALHNELHLKNLEIASHQQQVEALRRQLADVGARLDAVLSSKSWRWTAPVRALLRSREPR